MKKILFATSEAVPFIKTGGLADVAGALPKCFDKRYFDIRVILPKYACMKQEWKDKMQYVTHFYMDLGYKNCYVGIMQMEYDGIQFYFIDNEYYFSGPKPYDSAPWDLEKFAFFSKAVLSVLPVIGFRPDIIHCHDWQTGLVPVYLHDTFQQNEFFWEYKNNYDDPQPEIPGRMGCEDSKGYYGTFRLLFCAGQAGSIQRRQLPERRHRLRRRGDYSEQNICGGDQDPVLRRTSGRTSSGAFQQPERNRQRN